MIKTIMFQIVFTMTLLGCSSSNYRMQNDPNDSIVGNRVAVVIHNQKNEDISDQIIAKKISKFSLDHLKKKGYLPSSKRDADILLIFTPYQETVDEYVPPQTFLTQSYQPQTSTTTYVKNKYGQTIGTMEQQPSSISVPQYGTETIPGYNRTIVKTELFLQVIQQKENERPQMISTGSAWPKDWNKPFFSDDRSLESTVLSLLTKSIIGRVSPSSSNPGGSPGCAPRIGFGVDKSTFKITDISKDSPLNKIGIRVGDVVDSISLNGSEYSAQSFFISEVRLREGNKVDLTLLRNGKPLSKSIKVAKICDD